MVRKGLNILLFILLSKISYSQESTKSLFFENYTDDLTTRVYSVVKYNSILFIGNDKTNHLTYRPNSNINMGVGFNYRGFGLNLGFPVKVLNNDDDQFGTTNHFNADANSYTDKFNFTAFFEFYQGYYLSGSNSSLPPREDYALQIRSDVGFYVIGVSGTYVFNHDKVSYKAAFTQDAWQKKSAGSALLGGFCTYSHIGADSSLILPSIIHFDNIDEINESKSLDVGPLCGYMYSFVANEHWFLTISVSGGIGLNQLWLKTPETGNYISSINPGYRIQERVAFGYNSRRNYIGIAYVNENSRAIHQSGRIGYNVGNFRINLIHRFQVKKVPFVDKVMDTFNWIFMPRTDRDS